MTPPLTSEDVARMRVRPNPRYQPSIRNRAFVLNRSEELRAKYGPVVETEDDAVDDVDLRDQIAQMQRRIAVLERQLRSDRVAVGARVRRDHEPLARENFLDDPADFQRLLLQFSLSNRAILDQHLRTDRSGARCRKARQ